MKSCSPIVLIACLAFLFVWFKISGKTDVAVQIIANLYHSFPTQRTVIITHSNAALNDIFLKLMTRGDIDEREMVRLGSGERDLKTSSTHDFSKNGRIEYSLQQRGKLLEEVQRLSESLGISSEAERGKDGSPSYTCETAEFFYFDHVQRRIRSFQCSTANKNADEDVAALFPFTSYFHKIEGEKVTLSEANNHFSSLEKIFKELIELRPLELLHSARQRGDFMLMRQARIIAMTCTHAAIVRSHLLKIGFEYDNIGMF